MRRLLFTMAILAGCDKGATQAPAVAPAVAQPPVATVAATPAHASVELTAVTLADDCGGTAPSTAPATKAKAAKAMREDGAAKSDMKRRRCEQTSMQLAITAAAASRLTVKSVELFDEAGKSLGVLTASKPTRWSVADGTYATWDEMTTPGTQTNVSYVLSQLDWDQIPDRWNHTFTLKTVITVGGVDRPAEKTVTLTAPTTLPPNVKT